MFISLSATDESRQDIVADALRSTFEDDDIGIYLVDDRPDTPFSQGSQYDSPSPCSSTTSGVISCHDYESLSPWSIGSPASPQVINIESALGVTDVPQPQPRMSQQAQQHHHYHQQQQQQQMFTYPTFSQNTHNRSHLQHIQVLSCKH